MFIGKMIDKSLLINQSIFLVDYFIKISIIILQIVKGDVYYSLNM